MIPGIRRRASGRSQAASGACLKPVVNSPPNLNRSNVKDATEPVGFSRQPIIRISNEVVPLHEVVALLYTPKSSIAAHDRRIIPLLRAGEVPLLAGPPLLPQKAVLRRTIAASSPSSGPARYPSSPALLFFRQNAVEGGNDSRGRRPQTHVQHPPQREQRTPEARNSSKPIAECRGASQPRLRRAAPWRMRAYLVPRSSVPSSLVAEPGEWSRCSDMSLHPACQAVFGRKSAMSLHGATCAAVLTRDRAQRPL